MTIPTQITNIEKLRKKIMEIIDKAKNADNYKDDLYNAYSSSMIANKIISSKEFQKANEL